MSACHSDDESQGVTAVTFHHSGGVRMEDDKGGLSCWSGWGAKIKRFLHPACLLSERYGQNVYVADLYLRPKCWGRPNLGLKDHFELFAELHNLKEIADFTSIISNVRKKNVTKTKTLTPKYSHVKKNVSSPVWKIKHILIAPIGIKGVNYQPSADNQMHLIGHQQIWDHWCFGSFVFLEQSYVRSHNDGVFPANVSHGQTVQTFVKAQLETRWICMFEGLVTRKPLLSIKNTAAWLTEVYIWTNHKTCGTTSFGQTGPKSNTSVKHGGGGLPKYFRVKREHLSDC